MTVPRVISAHGFDGEALVKNGPTIVYDVKLFIE
jgi:hypothetical protein